MGTHKDELFDRNLKTIGSRIPVPDAPFHKVVDECADTLSVSKSLARGRRAGWLATLALAASIALAFGLFTGPFETGPKVQAATILAKLNEQITAPKVIELTMDSIAVDEVEVDGHLQVSASGVAGDLHVIVAKGSASIEVDLSLGISKDGGWVLLRKIDIPDPEIQAMLALFFPAGSETLLKIPAEMLVDEFPIDTGDFDEIMGVLAAKNLLAVFQELITDQADANATIVEQSDGTVVLTLPIDDAKSLEGLIRMAAKIYDGKSIPEGEITIDEDEGEQLFGSTLRIVYDPEAELVHSFSISDFGDKKGTLSISISGDSIDPDLLDSDRVIGPNTRTFDVSALMALTELRRVQLLRIKPSD